ncbi:phage protein NinX family protein [Enterobacter hormaechei]|uniref:phage protein NinX family protein n=1 Tax=Enterobacter hormaechei TaxID=158836 RepID=UPI0028746628|nr:phage protein NinX family protein [Enterobacter hormaechei]MDS0935050.1 DUF2591 family protein [Enterobacter hormaechei]
MDYSQLSDFEINKRVAQLHGGFALTLAVHDEPPSGKSLDPGRFDPCNNPADAWPIITANKISIYAMSEADKRGGWGAEAFHPNDAYSFNDNPLRAAMIVFLMMQDAKHA